VKLWRFKKRGGFVEQRGAGLVGTTVIIQRSLLSLPYVERSWKLLEKTSSDINLDNSYK